MAFEIRPVIEEEFESFARLMAETFGSDYRSEMLDYRRNIIELDRTLGVFDAGKIAATTGIFTYAMTVPGGAQIPTAGVTMVTVAPTHRRRGVLTSMMKRQLEDVRDRGEWAAALWASESQIYGRFGYGMAAQSVDYEIERVHARLVHGAEAAGSIRNIDKEEAAVALPPLWEAAQRARPGAMPRSAAWWEHRTLADIEQWRGGYTANRFAVYEEGGQAVGYVRYRIKQEWRDGVPDGHLQIADLLGTTPSALAALWQFVIGIDLIGQIHIEHRPADEPLLWMLNDSRRLKGRPSDGLWLRLLDVPKALEARTYSAEGRIVLDVTDGFCPWAGGRFELIVEGDRGRCGRTHRAANVKLAAADLGALYLGGTKVRSLVDAGRVTGEAAALTLLERMVATDVAPWCFEVF